AMLAEHDALDDPAERRRFARGCLRAAVVGPGGGDGTTTVVLAAFGAAIALAAGLAAFGLVHYPGLREGWSWLVYLGLVTVGLGSPAARRRGVVAALPALVTSWAAAHGDGVVAYGLALAAVLLPANAALYASRLDRRPESGIVAATCCAVLAGILSFAGYTAS